jgi:hypothetical protein
MLMMIQFKSGLRVEAILLAADARRMRLIAASQSDTFELNKMDGRWLTEQSEAVEIEAMIPLPGEDVSTFCADVHPRAIAAGRQ